MGISNENMDTLWAGDHPLGLWPHFLPGSVDHVFGWSNTTWWSYGFWIVIEIYWNQVLVVGGPYTLQYEMWIHLVERWASTSNIHQHPETWEGKPNSLVQSGYSCSLGKMKSSPSSWDGRVTLKFVEWWPSLPDNRNFYVQAQTFSGFKNPPWNSQFLTGSDPILSSKHQTKAASWKTGQPSQATLGEKIVPGVSGARASRGDRQVEKQDSKIYDMQYIHTCISYA